MSKKKPGSSRAVAFARQYRRQQLARAAENRRRKQMNLMFTWMTPGRRSPTAHRLLPRPSGRRY